MIYQYHCPKCALKFDVMKSASHMDDPEKCSLCLSLATREFVPSRVFFNKTKVEHPEYNPGLGCIVRNSAHRKELCKMKGVEEIGNESVETLHKTHEKIREDRREQAWAEVDRGWVGNGDIGG